MNRLYVAESTPTITGAMADRRLPSARRAIRQLAEAIAHDCGSANSGIDLPTTSTWFERAAHDLRSNRGASLIIAGMNNRRKFTRWRTGSTPHLGTSATPFRYVAPAEPDPVNQLQSLRELAGEMTSWRDRDSTLIIGGNPAFDAPADFDFAECLGKGEGARASRRCVRTKPRRSAAGICRKRMLWKAGAMRGLLTARLRLCSRSSSRFTAANPRTNYSRDRLGATRSEYEIVRAILAAARPLIDDIWRQCCAMGGSPIRAAKRVR